MSAVVVFFRDVAGRWLLVGCVRGRGSAGVLCFPSEYGRFAVGFSELSLSSPSSKEFFDNATCRDFSPHWTPRPIQETLSQEL